MSEIRQNNAETGKDWPNSFCGKPLPPAVEEWLTTREQHKRKRQEIRANIERHLREAEKTIDRMKRSVGLE